jgi:hypothetical protein
MRWAIFEFIFRRLWKTPATANLSQVWPWRREDSRRQDHKIVVFPSFLMSLEYFCDLLTGFSGSPKKGFLKKANPLRCSWFQLLRAGKLAGKLAVIECCYC